MADVLSPSLFASTYPNPSYPPQSKLFEPTHLSDKPTAVPPHERPSTTSGISRHSYAKSGDGHELTMNQPTLQRNRRHREYYIDGGDIVFLVENVLFRVHSYFFQRESPVFRKQFAGFAARERPGGSDADPCALEGVTVDDFTRFLWVFYNPEYSIYNAPTEDWAAILGLAHHWQFSEVKALAIREMEKQTIPALHKITIYHRYDVNRDLLFQSYMDLCLREEPLTIAEAEDLGLETWLMISTARETIRRGDGSASPAANRSSSEVERVISQVFRLASHE